MTATTPTSTAATSASAASFFVSRWRSLLTGQSISARPRAATRTAATLLGLVRVVDSRIQRMGTTPAAATAAVGWMTCSALGVSAVAGSNGAAASARRSGHSPPAVLVHADGGAQAHWSAAATTATGNGAATATTRTR